MAYADENAERLLNDRCVAAMRLQRSSPKVPWPHVLIEGRKYEAYQLPADAFDGQRLGVRDGDKVLADPRHHQDLTLVPVEARKGAIGLVIDPISKYFATVTVLMVPRPPCASLKACTPVEETIRLRLPSTGASPGSVWTNR
jgi:hypothetical protein